MSIDAVPPASFLGIKAQMMARLMGTKRAVHLALSVGLLLKIARRKKKHVFFISERAQKKLQYRSDAC